MSTLIDRREFSILTEHQKKLFIRYCKVYHKEVLEGVALAYACMRFNNRYNNWQPFSDKFIVWLHTY